MEKEQNVPLEIATRALVQLEESLEANGLGNKIGTIEFLLLGLLLKKYGKVK